MKNHNDYPEEFLLIMVVANKHTATELSAANSLFSAGAFYALLDLLMLAARVPSAVQNTKP